MQITVDELLQILGGKEAELFLLRRHVADLQAEIDAAAAKTAKRPPGLS